MSPNSRAVSEVVGALMVLMVIVSVAGILYTMSMPVISSGQDNIKFRNAFFDLFELREKIERVKSGLEPKSVHRIQLYDYSAEFKNEPVIKIGNKNYTVASVRVIGNGWTLAYENGAIIESGRNERMLSAPNINYNDDGFHGSYKEN
jgi:flagellin-like protein